MCARQRPSCPMLRIRAQRSYPGARGANKARAMRVGVAVTAETVPIIGEAVMRPGLHLDHKV